MEQKSPLEVKAALDEGADWILLDVREDEELAICKIDGAQHLPMGEIPARFEELDADKTIVCVCHHGMRSAQVAGFLMSQGFENIINLAGGVDRWAQEVDPQMARY